MPESEEQTQRLRNERDRLQAEVTALRFEQMKQDIAVLKQQLAEIQSLPHAEAGHLEYLATQTEPVEEDRIHDAVQARRATIQRTLRKFVDDGQVKRSGDGINSHGEQWRHGPERAETAKEPVDH